jgi:hypothetical protein
MEYKPKLLVPNIDDHTFTNDEGIDEDGDEDEEQELAVNVGDEMLRPCLMDLVKVGRAKLKEMHVKKIRMVAEERLRRKRTTTQYIMNRVKSMKEELMVTNIPPEHNDVDDSVWITYLREIRYDYYDD